MRYDEFRDRFQDALQDVGLFASYVEKPLETIDLANTSRRWKTYVRPASSRNSEPFHVSGRIAFDWDPFNAARGYTCEEDLLTELFGRRQRPVRTQTRWTRVDLALFANLPYGSTTPIPDLQTFAGWIGGIHQKLGAIISEVTERAGQIVAITGGVNEVEIQTQCRAEGALSLSGFSISGFRLVRIPRVWDDPQRREREKDISGEVAGLAHRFRDAYDEWAKSVADLATWIRYSPPPGDPRPIEPWFEDESEDGGPGSIH